MTDLTEATQLTNEDLKRWYELDKQLKALKGAEAMLRSRIFKQFFKDPQEGSKENKHPLNDGTGAILQATHNINRKVLIAELDALKAAINEEGSNLPKLSFDRLIKWTPEVVTSEYRALTEEERAAFDLCLDIKDGSPQLEIKIPKRAG
jgi:hypothetical protein